MFKKTLPLVILSIFILSACAPAVAQPAAAEEVPMTGSSEEKAEPEMEKPAEEMAEDAPVNEAPAAPAWMNAELTHVRTGEVFRISDFKGKVVLVENLAMWCSTCLKQQKEVKALHEALGPDSGLVSVGLDIDPNEVPADLKGYVESNGFDWYYAVAPKGVGGEIGQLYGANFLNPPLAPMLVVDRKGEGHPMPHGLKSMEDLKAFVEPFLAEGM